MQKTLKRLTKNITVPAYLLLLFIAVSLLIVGMLISLGLKSERDNAVREYQKQIYLQENSLSDIQNAALKEIWYTFSNMSGLILLFITIGVAFGLSNGITLVRVK